MGNPAESERVGEVKVKALRIIVYAAMLLTVLLMVFVPRVIRDYLFYLLLEGDGSLYGAMIAYVYLCCIPFLFALFSVKRLCDVIADGDSFSSRSIKQLSHIVSCCYVEAAVSLTAAGCFSLIYNIGIFTVSLFLVGICGAIAIFTTVLKELVKSAIRIREENELTI